MEAKAPRYGTRDFTGTQRDWEHAIWTCSRNGYHDPMDKAASWRWRKQRSRLRHSGAWLSTGVVGYAPGVPECHSGTAQFDDPHKIDAAKKDQNCFDHRPSWKIVSVDVDEFTWRGTVVLNAVNALELAGGSGQPSYRVLIARSKDRDFAFGSVAERLSGTC